MVRLTREETKLLVDIINKRREVLESKKTDALSNAKKARAWLDVQDEFNSNEFVRKRTAKQLRKSWDNLKMRKRKELANERQERMKTGGGPMPSTSREDFPPEMEIAVPFGRKTYRGSIHSEDPRCRDLFQFKKGTIYQGSGH
ncbi:myb/SANT-like DNA-binding domain-containing protein 3 [Ischnura elegans]|uniref:myb/SANT-like DNA-binding domain-containing protein 3 n=1 Tax=Ischnura elegans TaxID=197161 RepID=UPI001ED87A62|nr:myb/SANT-like DNA-binding domain-containing protein 3 [Ischnura elegans]